MERLQVDMLQALQYGPRFDSNLLESVDQTGNLQPMQFHEAIVALRGSGLISSRIKPYDQVHHREQYELLPLGKEVLGSLDTSL